MANFIRVITGYEGELGHLQLRNAEHWFQRGEEAPEPDAKLFFYYTAFNAINLCHGSKGRRGDDPDVIANAMPLLRFVARAAIDYTKAEFQRVEGG